eukprot:TRINITY_DN67918_c10_g3_i2.p1 TRINITY_DN67918_c10_g3~~TRINITY_DN67918_c10_g3_i2.p1  ORF type:complete len:683 (+),score=50.39 TRINITY_DN67918_c10_g3_i2:27-2051(+)
MIVTIVLLTRLVVCLQAFTVFYVSTNGNDGNKGTSPTDAFRTPKRALSAVEASGTPTKVVFESGTYYVSETLSLSGSASHSTWTAATAATISGNKLVQKWQKYGSNLELVANVPKNTSITQLFVGGSRAQRARLPKCVNGDCQADYSRGFGYENTYQYVKAFKPYGNGFVFSGNDIDSSWPDLKQAEVLAFGSWTASWYHIQSVDRSTHTVYFKEKGEVGKFAWASAKRYIVENIKAGWTDNGEFYNDIANGKLYYRARSQTEYNAILSGKVTVGYPVVPTIFQLQSTQNVTISNLNILHGNDGGIARYHDYFGPSALITLDKSADVELQKLRVGNSGMCGIQIHTVSDVQITRCSVVDVGGDGIQMISSEAVNVLIAQNRVNDTGKIFMKQPAGIRLRGKGGIIAEHNEVQRNSYGGILVGWQRMPISGLPYPTPLLFTVRYNYVHDYGLGILCDFGGVYLSSADNLCFQKGQNHCSLPTYVYQNFITRGRHFQHKNTGYGSNGIYMDEQVASVYMEKNLITHVGATGIYFHCGTNNTATNNIIAYMNEIKTNGYISSCNSGGNPTWPNISHGETFTHNIVYVDEGKLTTDSDYRATHFNYNDYYHTNGKPMEFPGRRTWKQWQQTGNDTNSVVADPLFVDPKSGNFALKSNSPALKLGFQPIDQHQFGPTKQ